MVVLFGEFFFAYHSSQPPEQREGLFLVLVYYQYDLHNRYGQYHTKTKKSEQNYPLS